MGLADITQRRGLEILISLKNGAKNFSELADCTGGSRSTIKRRTDELSELGVIKREKSDKFPFEDTFELTLKGHMLAKLAEDLSERAWEKRSVVRIGENWILALLHVLGGEIKGTTRLQKLLFLLKEEHEVEHPYEFSKSSYGPFCKDIMTDVEELEQKGFVRTKKKFFEPRSPTEEGVIRTDYVLPNVGKIIAKREFNKLPLEAKDALLSLKSYHQMSLDNLLKYIHSRYPKYSQTS